MKRWIKILIAALTTPIVIVILIISIWLVMNWQGVIDPYQVGDPKTQFKVLIASQGSEFKNKLLTELVQQLRSDGERVVVDLTRGKSSAADQQCDRQAVHSNGAWTIKEV